MDSDIRSKKSNIDKAKINKKQDSRVVNVLPIRSSQRLKDMKANKIMYTEVNNKAKSNSDEINKSQEDAIPKEKKRLAKAYNKKKEQWVESTSNNIIVRSQVENDHGADNKPEALNAIDHSNNSIEEKEKPVYIAKKTGKRLNKKKARNDHGEQIDDSTYEAQAIINKASTENVIINSTNRNNNEDEKQQMINAQIDIRSKENSNDQSIVDWKSKISNEVYDAWKSEMFKPTPSQMVLLKEAEISRDKLYIRNIKSELEKINKIVFHRILLTEAVQHPSRELYNWSRKFSKNTKANKKERLNKVDTNAKIRQIRIEESTIIELESIINQAKEDLIGTRKRIADSMLCGKGENYSFLDIYVKRKVQALKRKWKLQQS